MFNKVGSSSLRKSITMKKILNISRLNYRPAVTKPATDDFKDTDSTSKVIPQTQPFVNPITPVTNLVKPIEKLDIKITSSIASFDDIPGPKTLYLITKLWSMIPIMSTEVAASTVRYFVLSGEIFGNSLSWGNKYWQRLFEKFFRVYGPVVRLAGPFGGDLVLLNRPEHAKILFQSELSHPVRSALESVELYRKEKRNQSHTGIFSGSGVHWESLRKSIDLPMQRAAIDHLETLDEICDQFVAKISTIRNAQEEMPADFKQDIDKWSMECLYSVMLNKRIGFLGGQITSNMSDCRKVLTSFQGATDSIRKCEFGFHFWKFFETPSFKSLTRNLDRLESVLSKHIERAQEDVAVKKSSEKVSLLEALLVKENMRSEDVLTLFLDMMLIGINATTHTVAFLLYHLAKSPRCQQKLYEEICKQPAKLSKANLAAMPYLGACIKEILRLKPAMPILTRVTNTDLVIHNYLIPRGTSVMMASRVSSISDEHFEDGRKFLPERWLSSEVGWVHKELQDYAFMPYGHGPRCCIAKDLAETQIGLFICKALKKFRLEYFYDDIESSKMLFSVPNKPLKFRFVDRI